jgi:hypothetical protein
MAHAGTPTDLAKQPATSSSLWKPLLTAIVILAIGFGMAMATSFIIGNRSTNLPVDRSYDQIETQRGATTLSGVAVDTNNAVEKAAAAKARAMSGVPAVVDKSYDAVENARGVAPLSGTTIDPTTFDLTPRGQLP